MKTIKLFINNKRDPLTTVKSEGGELLKHQIANLILTYADLYDIKKIRVIVEDEVTE